MTGPEGTARTHAKKRLAMVVAGSIAGVAAGLAAVYGIGTLKRNAADAACAPAVELAQRLAPLARGEVAAFTVAERSLRVPDLAFRLLNLWATWCVPCRKEMPALDALEGKLGGPAFEVVAVNIDTRDPGKPRAWLKEIGVGRLGYYADPSAKVFQDLKTMGRAAGMPTTLLVDPSGCEIGTMAGPAEWNSADGMKLVSAATRSAPPSACRYLSRISFAGGCPGACGIGFPGSSGGGLAGRRPKYFTRIGMAFVESTSPATATAMLEGT